jgi:hypothetical protein
MKATVVLYSEDKEIASQEYAVEHKDDHYVNKERITFLCLDAEITNVAIYAGGIRLGHTWMFPAIVSRYGVETCFLPGSLSFTEPT